MDQSNFTLSVKCKIGPSPDFKLYVLGYLKQTSLLSGLYFFCLRLTLVYWSETDEYSFKG